MSTDYIHIGATPAAEDCVPVGAADYDRLSRIECDIFIAQLRREFGEEPDGCRLRQKSFPHDFGSYREVLCYFDDENQDAIDYAFKCEGEASEYWDSEALASLKEQGITDALRRISD